MYAQCFYFWPDHKLNTDSGSPVSTASFWEALLLPHVPGLLVLPYSVSTSCIDSCLVKADLMVMLLQLMLEFVYCADAMEPDVIVGGTALV